MGIFDKVLGGSGQAEPFGPHEGFAGILLGASACDGHFADEEIQGLMTQLARMKMYSRYTDKQWGQMMNRLLGVAKRKGVDELLQMSTDACPTELRKTAFCNACDVVLADGTVEEDEKVFIDALQQKLEISNDTAETIIKVMVIKNKG